MGDQPIPDIDGALYRRFEGLRIDVLASGYSYLMTMCMGVFDPLLAKRLGTKQAHLLASIPVLKTKLKLP
jgi:hypothetical protein